MYVEYISNKNGYSGSFHINGPYFETFYFILKWVKARKLPHFIFIMLCFKMVVATPGYKAASAHCRESAAQHSFLNQDFHYLLRVHISTAKMARNVLHDVLNVGTLFLLALVCKSTFPAVEEARSLGGSLRRLKQAGSRRTLVRSLVRIESGFELTRYVRSLKVLLPCDL
jgi:hypothetical protein